MCGILGVKSKQVTDRNLTLIYNFITESQIRGKHATGVSWIAKGGELVTIKEPLPAKEFLDMHWEGISASLRCAGKISLIAHTRYSTSGIKDNQPIANENLSLVLNGVITQADPNQWLDLFGVDCHTTNDAEIAHIKMSEGINPLLLSGGIEDTHCSMSVITLNSLGGMMIFRNGRRPMWHVTDRVSETTFVASTKDIIMRATRTPYIMKEGKILKGYIIKMAPGFVSKVTHNGTKDVQWISNINLEDWQ